MMSDTCRGGREEAETSDKLEQDHSPLEGSWAGTQRATTTGK